MFVYGKSLVKSIKERCRVCYTCVRECPAKAIRILHGQADVIAERCIGCGNCVLVCSQNAKEVYSCVNIVNELFEKNDNVVAIVAPSFPVECEKMGHEKYIGMIKALGFKHVYEVAFGADLVALEYRELIKNNPKHDYITSPCPAIVAYVEYYYPSLVDKLSPIVSPMVAAGRYLKMKQGRDVKVVFIGPCIAKKAERQVSEFIDDVDAVLTFKELNELFEAKKLDPQKVASADFDPPYSRMGKLFPLTRGLLAAAEIDEDLIEGTIISTEGRKNFTEAIKGLEKSAYKVQLLDLLCCQGCISGAGCSVENDETFLFHRRQLVGRYTKEMMEKRTDDFIELKVEGLDLTRSFKSRDQRIGLPSKEAVKKMLEKMGKHKPEDELNCGACGYETCQAHAIAVLKGLAENEMCLPYTIDQLKGMVDEIEHSHKQVLSIQDALIQAEKLANIGQLAAGVAHEVNNPLGSVLLYTHLLLEKFEEGEHISKTQVKEDLQIIVDQAGRCKKIIAGLLDFARQNKVIKQNEDVYQIVLKNLKTVNLPSNIQSEIIKNTDNVFAEVDHDQVAQVFINLFTNAQAAMEQGGKLTVTIFGDDDFIKIAVKDTGVGIPKENLLKIFNPFFTTKQIGKGTGLGLAVLYGIVKMHYGEVKVESNTDKDAGEIGTTFTLIFPRKEKTLIRNNK